MPQFTAVQMPPQASLLFGNQINLDSGILSPFPQLPEVETSASKVVCEMYNIQDTLIAQAQTALRTMDEAHIATSPQDITVFPVGLYVLARYTTQSPTRLHTLWRGPFQVVSIHNSDYTLLDITTKKHKHLHISNLKQFVFNPKHTDPAAIIWNSLLNPLFSRIRMFRIENKSFQITNMKMFMFLRSYI